MKTNIHNVNLSENSMQAILKFVGPILNLSDVVEHNHLAIIKLDTLDLENRLRLRKIINEGITDNIVIVSSNSKFSLFSWRVGALHFLEFPFRINSLKVLKSKIKTINHDGRTDKEKLKMAFAGGFDLIHLRDICAIEGQGNYCKFYLRNSNSQTYTTRIGKLSTILEKEVNFCKITKSLIINVNNIAQIKGTTVKYNTTPKLEINLSSRAAHTLRKNLLWLD